MRHGGEPARRQRRPRCGADARSRRRSRAARRVRHRHLVTSRARAGGSVRRWRTARPGRRARVGRAVPRSYRPLREHSHRRGAGIRAQCDDACLPRPTAVDGRRQARGRGRQEVPREPRMAARCATCCGRRRHRSGGLIRGAPRVSRGAAACARRRGPASRGERPARSDRSAVRRGAARRGR